MAIKDIKFDEKEYYERYSGEITCAFKSNIFLDKDGKERCNAKRTSEREKYILKELTNDVVLIEVPKDMLVIEFETHDSTGSKNVTKEKLKEFVRDTEKNCSKYNLDYCIVSHGGTSDYVYICNIENLIEGKESDCKKEIAKKIIPKVALPFLDLSNLGKTLVPIINRPHWKDSKYHGAIHKIIEGKSPDKHKNKIPDVILQKLIYEKRPEIKKLNYEGEEDINSIQLTDIISTSGLKKRGMEYQGSNPWHGSSTGMNFSINISKNVWHCFRCNVGGGVAHAIGLNHEIINSCSDSISSEQFKEILKIAQDNYGLKIRIKEKKVNEEIVNIITSFFDKSDLAEKIWKINPYFYDSSKLWWLWNMKEKRWEVVDETEILLMVKNGSRANTIISKEKGEIIEAMKQYGREKKPKNIKKSWIQFKDMIFDYETEESFEASPEYFVTNPIPWEVSYNGNTPTMDRIFSEWVGEDKKELLYEILAYCLIPDYPLHRIFCFIGSGMNGKSKFLDLLRKFVGNKNVCSTELDTLLNSRFEVTRLHKKLVCQMGETDFNEMSKTSILKKLSGGDLIGFEYKNKDPFEEINYAKIIIATNNLPATTDKTIGFYRRWSIIDFPNQFSEKKDILAEIPEEEYNNLATKSLLNIKEIMNKRSFHKEGSIEERKKNYESHSNPIKKFIEENYKTGNESDFETKSGFHRKLNDWLKENKHREMSEMAVSKWLRKNGFEEGRDYIDWYEYGKLSKRRVRVWYGLKEIGQGGQGGQDNSLN
jgi:P4 family phage/plasmid primase-like protien